MSVLDKMIAALTPQESEESRKEARDSRCLVSGFRPVKLYQLVIGS